MLTLRTASPLWQESNREPSITDRKPNSMMAFGIFAVMALLMIDILSPIPFQNILERNGASGLSTSLEETLYVRIVWFYDTQQELFEYLFPW